MKNKKGFTLIELQVNLIITAILLLMVGAVCRMSSASYLKAKSTTEIYEDLAFALKFIQTRVHEAKSISTATATAPWITKRLVLDDHAFGIYEVSTTERQFVYLNDKDDLNNRKILFIIPSTNLDWTVSNDTKSVTVTIFGKKKTVPFNLSSMIRKRAG